MSLRTTPASPSLPDRSGAARWVPTRSVETELAARTPGVVAEGARRATIARGIAGRAPRPSCPGARPRALPPLSLAQYVSELWKKKQSDVLRYLQRMRTWEYRQLASLVRLTGPSRPDKARRLGYKAKQGYVIYRVRVRRGGRKKPVSKVRRRRRPRAARGATGAGRPRAVPAGCMGAAPPRSAARFRGATRPLRMLDLDVLDAVGVPAAIVARWRARAGCGGSPAAGRRAEGRRRPAPRGRRGGGDAGEHGERATGTRRRRRRAPEAGPCPCPPTFGGGAKAGKARGRGRSALEGPPTPCVGGAERASSAVATRGSRVRRRFWAASRVAGPPAFGRADGSGPSETALRAAPRSLSGSVRGETERRLCPGRRSVGARRRGAPGRDPAGRERRRARRPSRSGGFGAGRLGEGGCRLLSSRSSPRWLARSLFFPIVLSLALFFSARPLPPPVLFCFLFSLSSLRLRFPTSAFPLFFLSSPFCRESSTASR